MFIPKSRSARNQQVQAARQNLQKRFCDALKISSAQPTQESDKFYQAATNTATPTPNADSTQSSAPSTSSRLLELPPEIFERIAESCDSSTLKALRLTSRECASRLQRTYVKLFFTNIGVLLCRETSITAAINILHHPIFGPTVQSLAFYVDGISRPQWPVVRKASLEHRMATGKFRNEYDNMRQQSADIRLLRELFSQLKKQDRVLPLVIAGDAHHAVDTPIGLGSILHNKGLMYQYTEDVGCLEFLIAALEKTKYLPTSFSVLPTASLPVRRIPYSFHTILDCVKDLDISFWCNYSDQEDSKVFGNWIAQALNLETLTLRANSDRPDAKINIPSDGSQREVFLDIASVLEAILESTMPKLQKLTLDGPAASFGDLVGFIGRNSGLRELGLKGAKIWYSFDSRGMDVIPSKEESVSQALKRLTKLSVVEVDEEADKWWEDRHTWLI